MKKRLPPLNWLRAFEVSARLLNFTHAAEELNLTQAAIRTILNRGRSRPDLPDECPELLANLPEFFRFMWRTKTSSREAMKRFVATAPSGCRVVCLRSNRDTEVFLASLGAQAHQAVQGH